MDKKALLEKIEAAAEAGETRLELRDQQLTELPPEIGKLNKLTDLNLQHNQLTELPPEIGQLTNLQGLVLYLNPLTTLPAEISQLANLKSLVLGRNCFLALPINQIKKLNLTALYFVDTPMAEFPIELTELTTLTLLNLRNNQLTELPPDIVKLNKLVRLELYNNQLTELPTELHQLEALEILELNNNPNLRFPPEEIVALGTQAIKNFLRAAHAGNQHVWESKLLLVGEGGVGKTSLLNALNGALLNDTYETGTVGIEIGDLTLPCPDTPDANMHLRCWDFAGQDFNHATHQFFFSNRALFLLVWNARHGYQQGKLYRWLENIKVRAPKAKVILVATHTDQPHSDYPMADLRAKYPQIVDISEVSNQTGVGIAVLRDCVQTHAATLPLMGLRWPKTWLKAATAVRALSAQHMPRQALAAVIQQYGLDAPESDILMRWLHDLGDILLFLDEAEIRDLVMLDPGWMIRHVGVVLRSDEVKEQRGILTRTHLQALWSDLDRHIQDHFLRMMDKFDLAYLIPDDAHDRSLIVERLSHDPVDYHADWDAFKSTGSEIKQRFRLGSMQPGIPSWFIARCHRFTMSQHWLFGVLFKDAEPARHLALIQANSEQQVVDITVRGHFPQRFMALLQDGFLDTLKRYQGLSVERLIPCHGYNDYIDSPCKNTFTLEIQEKKLLKNPTDTDFHCNDCDTALSRLALVEGIGAGALTQDYTQGRTKALIAQQADVMQDVMALHQRNFINLWRQAQDDASTTYPNVFTLQAKDKGNLLSAKKYQLQLYCQQPGAWHSVEPSGCCEFSPPNEWAKKAAPYLFTLCNILKISHNRPGIVQNAVKRMISLLENVKLQDAPRIEAEAGISTESKAPDTYAKVPGAELSVIRELMDELADKLPGWGGLTRRQTPEGDILWLCKDHLQEYQNQRKKPAPQDASTRAALHQRAIQASAPNARCDALSLLVKQWPDDETHTLLLQRAVQDADENVRCRAIGALVEKWTDDHTRDCLMSCASEDAYDTVRARAGEALITGWWHQVALRQWIRQRLNTDASDVVQHRLRDTIAGARERLAGFWEAKLSAHAPKQAMPETLPGYPAIRVIECRLRNIGVFEDTRSTFRSGVNVLLGDNAAGKSTLLKCLALAAIGPDAANEVEAAAAVYLRQGTDKGAIEVAYALVPDPDATSAEMGYCVVGLQITADTKRFAPMPEDEMTLKQPEQVVLRCANSAKYLGKLRDKTDFSFGLVCAYGATRTFSDNRFDLQTEHKKQENEWVLALFQHRAWLVNPEVLSKLLRGDTSNIEGAPVSGLSDDVVHKLRHALEGMLPKAGLLNDENGDIRLKQQAFLFSELSDGYQSTLALVGHLLRCTLRLLNWTSDPTQMHGITLVDEIDLHLHPTWQKHIVQDLRTAFPNVQLILSTHSPLIVGALDAASVLLLKSGDTASNIIPLPTVLTETASMKAWRADQILTGPGFELQTSVSHEGEDWENQYEALWRLPEQERTEPEQMRLQKLSAMLDQEIPRHEQTPHAREAMRLFEAWALERLKARPAEEVDKIIQETKQFLLRDEGSE